MPDVKDTRTIIDSLRRCCHVGFYADTDPTDPGDTCVDCAYCGKCGDLELDAAELILLLDDLTDHQFEIDRDALIDLRHCNGCSLTGYCSECRVHNMYGDSGCDKIQEDAADILEKMYHRYNIMHALGPRMDLIAFDGFRSGKIYDIKTIHKEDMIDAMAYLNWITEIMKTAEGNAQKKWYRQSYECHFTPKSIERSADHKTVCVLWQDGSKTIVKLSDNDKDDIDTAFAYALAKKIFGTNTHLKKVVRQKLNEHKPKNKKEDK